MRQCPCAASCARCGGCWQGVIKREGGAAGVVERNAACVRAGHRRLNQGTESPTCPVMPLMPAHEPTLRSPTHRAPPPRGRRCWPRCPPPRPRPSFGPTRSALCCCAARRCWQRRGRARRRFGRSGLSWRRPWARPGRLPSRRRCSTSRHSSRCVLACSRQGWHRVWCVWCVCVCVCGCGWVGVGGGGGGSVRQPAVRTARTAGAQSRRGEPAPGGDGGRLLHVLL